MSRSSSPTSSRKVLAYERLLGLSSIDHDSAYSRLADELAALAEFVPGEFQLFLQDSKLHNEPQLLVDSTGSDVPQPLPADLQLTNVSDLKSLKKQQGWVPLGSNSASLRAFFSFRLARKPDGDARDIVAAYGQSISHSIAQYQRQQERNVAEANISQQYAQYINMLWALPELVVVRSAEPPNQVLYLNDDKRWGLTMDELGPVPSSAKDRALLKGCLREATKTGQPYTLEYMNHTLDGEDLWLSESGAKEHMPGLGEVIISQVSDITKRKNLEEQGRIFQEQQRLVLDTIEAGILVANQANEVWLVNKALQQTLQLHKSAGQPVESALPQPLWEAMATAKNGQRSEIEVHLNNDETRLVLAITAQPISLFDGPGRLWLVDNLTESRLREEQLMLITEALESSTNGIIITDPNVADNPIIYANPAFEAMTGYDRKEIIGVNCRFLHRADRYQEGLMQLREAIKNKTSANVFLRNYRKDGTLFYNQLDISPVYNKAGKLTNYLGIQSDITERVLAERALVESEAHLSALFKSSLQAFLVVNPNYCVESFNPVAKEQSVFMGIPPLAAGAHVTSYMSLASYSELTKNIAEVFKTAKPLRFERLIEAKSKKLWLDLSLTPSLGEDGLVKNVCISALDITHRKVAEQEVRHTKSQLQVIFDNLDAVVVSLNSHTGRMYQISPACAKLFGHQPEEFLHDTDLLLNLMHPEDRDHWADNMARLQLGESFDMEVRIKNPEEEGTWRIFFCQMRLETMRNDASEAMLNGIFTDLTERTKAQEALKAKELAEKALQFKTDFLASMSHEIRTPLNGILGMSEFLLEGSLLGTQREYAETILISSQKLMTIINDVLDLSKIEAGRLFLHESTFELKKLVDHVFDLFSSTLERIGHVAMTKTIDPALPQYIVADETKLGQVIGNMLNNAIKFTEEGSINLRLLAEGDSMRVEVQDTGPGITPKDQDKLFEKFYQAPNNSPGTGGTGLGLAISRELVQLMDGEMGMNSQVGQGSTFFFTIPLKAGYKDDLPADDILVDKAVRQPQQLGLHVLLVEDKEVNQKVAVIMLRKLGCTYDLARNGLEALKLYQPGKHQLILMDIQMPLMDGVKATKLLRSRYRELPPIIGLSANALEGDADRYLEQGLDDYLAKPLSLAQLQSCMVKHLSGAPATPIKKAAPHQAPAGKVLNVDFLKQVELLAGDSDAVVELVESYLSESAEFVGSVQTALNQKDADKLRRDLHAWKGMSGSVGAQRMQELLKQWEQEVINNTTVDHGRWWPMVQQAQQQLEKELTQYIEPLSPHVKA